MSMENKGETEQENLSVSLTRMKEEEESRKAGELLFSLERIYTQEII